MVWQTGGIWLGAAMGACGATFVGAVIAFVHARRARRHKYEEAPLQAVFLHHTVQELVMAKDRERVQPQARVGGTAAALESRPSLPIARLVRTPSVSSQSSLDSATSRATGHRGSSPQIRTYAPDGRSTVDLGCAGGGPRSPSPLRAASLDARAAPTANNDRDAPLSPRLAPRCLSPLLIPPQRRMDRSNSLVEGACGSSSCGPLSPGGALGGLSAAGTPGSLGALRPDLYARREAPLFVRAAEDAPCIGRLHLRLLYDFDKSDLNVHLIEAHELADAESGGFSEPFVRVHLVPDVDARDRRTPARRNDGDPLFDHHFKFPISHDELGDKTLLLQMLDCDRFSRNEVTGEVRIELAKLEVAGGLEVWAEVGRHRRPPEELQELLLAMSYLPSAERLTVVVVQARNLLPPKDAKEPLESYVKVYLIVNGKRLKKKKTNKKESENPFWNEALSFSLPSTYLQTACVEVCVVSSGSGGGSSPCVRWCCVGGAEPGLEGRHWTQMTKQPRKTVSMWHTLR